MDEERTQKIETEGVHLQKINEPNTISDVQPRKLVYIKLVEIW